MTYHARPMLNQYAYLLVFVFFFNDTATTEIYTLSLHDALPISPLADHGLGVVGPDPGRVDDLLRSEEHTSELQSPYVISYAVFCLKKKKKYYERITADVNLHRFSHHGAM